MTTNSVRVEVLDVTPEQARKLLAGNTHNRRLNPRAVERIAADITENRWVFNGEPIQIGAKGLILNGQTRLTACVKAERPIKTVVITGLPDHAQDTIDIGRPRSLSDVLGIEGEPQPTLVAAIARRACMWEKGYFLNTGTNTPSVPEAAEFLGKNPDIREAAQIAQAGRKEMGIPGSVIGLAFWVCARVDHTDAKIFFIDQLTHTLGLRMGSPARALRYRLAEEANRKGRIAETDALAYIIRGWNAFRAGETLTKMQRPKGGWNASNMPEPK